MFIQLMKIHNSLKYNTIFKLFDYLFDIQKRCRVSYIIIINNRILILKINIILFDIVSYCFIRFYRINNFFRNRINRPSI